MGITKNAMARYKALDRCFKNSGRIYFWEDLLEECNRALESLEGLGTSISRRQLFNDIRFMESPQGWEIPLERIKIGKRVYYRYEDTSYSIDNQPMNEMEAQQLKSALLILSRFSGMPQFEWVSELILKLEHSFNLKQQTGAIISFESNEFLKGQEFLGELFNAILYKKVLKIRYKPFTSDTPNDIIFHPWYLKQFNNRWFLFGLNEATERIENPALDRMEQLEEIQKPYVENTETDFTEYFEDIIGVTKPENTAIEKIVLRFSSEQAPYVLTKPLHGSQGKPILDETGLTLPIKVIPNFEMERLFLSFGESLEVLGPPEIRNLMAKRLALAVENYKK